MIVYTYIPQSILGCARSLCNFRT